MLIRALIVLLVVLNLGAAAWWLTRPAPAPEPPPALPAGVARLQLVGEEAPAAPLPASPAPTLVPPAPAVCFSLGPFTSEAAAIQARDALGADLLRSRLREAPGASASGYQVVMPPAASLEEAQATAARIGAAGFDDFLVVRQGDQANGIALGRYRSRDAAERRIAELQAGGFTAQLQPVGRAGPSLWWLDTGAAEGADPAALARRASSAPPQPLECTALR
ncbi:SPOR domain-containing protein [Pseudoxanthomonas sp. LjRoot125]|uniref:SPOR domain-containing protein n=1 Tax=Pseudoxanthomonas sp. LjRoot125 TaxID=3342258 RepID=UPI003E11320F